ncbi:MAG: nuclear transport factor 2 family protein [Pseudomonadota bacterium]
MNDSVQSQDHDSSLDESLQRYIYFFNNLENEIDNIGRYTDPDIEFRDPFNHVVGHQAMTKLLRKFYSSVDSPHFDVTQSAWNGNVCFIRWDFSGKLSLFGDWNFPGVSELHFSDSAKVCKHIDHWDSGEHFYARLPILGRLVQMIRRRV